MLSSEVRINPDVFDLTRFEPDAFSIEWLQTLKKSRKISCDQSKITCFVIPKEYCSVFRFIDKNEVAAIILSDRVSFVGDEVNVRSLKKDVRCGSEQSDARSAV